MSKPRIFGHCAAGCDWEVPHKSDFDAVASIIARFPAPTVLESKTLPGAGYYFISCGGINAVVYWDGQSTTAFQNNVNVSAQDDNLNFSTYSGFIAADGKITVQQKEISINLSTKTSSVNTKNTSDMVGVLVARFTEARTSTEDE